MSAFEWSFVAGLFVICVFAWDQFNLKSWKAQRKYALMLSVLTPSDLRGGKALRRAFVVYLVILALFYSAAVFLVSVGVIAFSPESAGFAAGLPVDAALPAGGEGPVEALERADPAGPGSDPWVPLAISLAMVGLAPRIAILREFELKLRLLAHNLMGIPSALHVGSESISTAPLSIADIGPELVTAEIQGRIDAYLASAERVLGPGAWVDRLERSLMKILAFKVWVVDHEIFPGSAIRERYELIEEDVRSSIDAVFEDLDDLSGLGEGGPRVIGDAQRPAQVKRWEGRIKAAADLSDDACALMFVYYEKSGGATRGGGRAEAVVRYLGDVLDQDRSTVTMLNMLLTSVLSAVLIAALWGFGQSSYVALSGGTPLYGPAHTGLLFALTAFVTYGPATLAAVWWRGDGVVRSGRDEKVFPVMRLGGLFLVAAAVSLLCLVMLNIGNAIFDPAVTVAQVARNFQAVLWYAVTLELPRAVLGGIQGVFIALMFDQSGEDIESGRASRLSLIHGLALMLWATLLLDLTGRGMTVSALLMTVPVAGLIGWASSLTLLAALRRLRNPRSTGGQEPSRVVAAERT